MNEQPHEIDQHTPPEHQPDSESHLDPSPYPDPGTPFSRLIALILAIVFASGIILWQNLPESTQYKVIGESPAVVLLSADSPAPGRFGQIDLPARIFLRGHTLFDSQPTDYTQMVMSQFDIAYTPDDQVRTIIMSGVYESSDQTLDRINALRIELTDTPDPNRETEAEPLSEYDAINQELILAELDALESIYTNGRDSISDQMNDQLIARYGVLGRAATTHGLDANDPARQPIVTGFGWIAALLLLFFTVIVVGFFAGLVLLLIGIINLSTGKLKLRFKAPPAGGSVFLETYALFLAGFAVLSIGLFILSEKVNPALGILSLPLQWILIFTPAWAILRGMRASIWRRAIGLHSGEGILKEIACGFITYIASIPVYLFGVLVTLVLILVQSALSSGGAQPTQPMTNPVFDLISDSGPILIILVFSLATVWAPIAEELIFRGALHRHINSRVHWVATAFITALLFAYMHSYGPLMVAPLIALGFMFAFMRQWRDSIIPCITAHFIHNASLVGFMILLINLLKDPFA
ncbi:MAG: CPBP family intramembrane metalloprotease [Phycisphaerales bacterium]|nr:CPBP family intramembrane metalloprotease [Phycisphaerales bacterium]